MNLNDLAKPTLPCRTVFQRKEGELRILQVPVKTLKREKPKPMFPINKNRGPEDDAE